MLEEVAQKAGAEFFEGIRRVVTLNNTCSGQSAFFADAVTYNRALAHASLYVTGMRTELKVIGESPPMIPDPDLHLKREYLGPEQNGLQLPLSQHDYISSRRCMLPCHQIHTVPELESCSAG